MVEMLCKGQKMLQQTHSHPGMMEPMEQIDNRLLKSYHTSIAIGRASWILELRKRDWEYTYNTSGGSEEGGHKKMDASTKI